MTDAAHIVMRRLQEADIEKLGFFFRRNNRPEITNYFRPFPLNESTARKLLESKGKDLFFVAEESGRFLAFSMMRGQDTGYEIPAFGIFVDWENQNRGIGKDLSQWTFRWADLIMAKKIRLSVFEENIQARTLYEKLGFIETGRRRDDDGRINIIMHQTRLDSKTEVFVSTQGCLSNETLAQRLYRWSHAGIFHIELSNHAIEDEQKFLSEAVRFPGKLLIHHFFPANRRDMILNLASADKICRQDTLRFFQRSIEWSAKLGAPFFSFHAGYVTDPVGREAHGFVLAEPASGNYEAAWERFAEGVGALREIAKEFGIGLLIENNIVTERNKGKLLLATPEEFIRFLDQSAISNDIGILLDWGHWLVSANTYRLNLNSFLPIREHIRGVHLHTNNGLVDEHLPFTANDLSINIIKEFNPKFVTLEGKYANMEVLQRNIMQTEKIFNE